MTLATLLPLMHHKDARGSFTEVFRDEITGRDRPPVQASICFSKRGVLRGMHLHRRHGDCWALASGHIQVGLYRNGKREMFILGTEAALWIPTLTWHGFLALEDTTLLYLQDSYYDPSDEAVARWDSCGIDWAATPLAAKWEGWPILSDRDRNAPTLEEVECASR